MSAETVAACLTPPGAAAIATLALHGPDAWHIARSLFRPVSKSGQTLPEQPEAGRVWVGRFGDALAEFAFEWRRPRHEVGADSVVDHREAARRECEA